MTTVEQLTEKLRDLGLSSSPLPADTDVESIRSMPGVFVAVIQAVGDGFFENTVLCRLQNPPRHAKSGRWPVSVLLRPGEGEEGLATWWRRMGPEYPNLIPFALAPGGDVYCFLGEVVVLWNHETGDSYKAASSFADFVDRLEVDDTRVPKATLDRIKVSLSPELLKKG